MFARILPAHISMCYRSQIYLAQGSSWILLPLLHGEREHTAPLLAWGFLGPDTGGCLKPLCFMFKVSIKCMRKNHMISSYSNASRTLYRLHLIWVYHACCFRSFNFQDTVLEFVQDVFNFTKVRYTTVDELADDVKALAQRMIAKLMDNLSW